MIMSAAGVSIVIPTHNRHASVERALRALSAQSYPLSDLEVIVVADGCTDATRDVAQGRWPFALRLLEQPARGPAAARNRGASAAAAPLVIFLDDDIEVEPDFVAAHVRAHAAADDVVAIGYLPPRLPPRRGFFTSTLREWWYTMFERMRQPGHRFTYVDLLSGNVSLTAALFSRVGGFDESLRCHEDFDLGARLLASGAHFCFARDARGWHHDQTTLDRSLERKREEGRADVALARARPLLAAAMPLAATEDHLSPRGRRLKRLALRGARRGRAAAALARLQLTALEAAGLRPRWRRLLNDLLSYWYWCGVADALEADSLEDILRQQRTRTAITRELDLRDGLGAAMRELDQRGASSLRLRWGPIVVAEIREHPAAEPLRGRHLWALLRTPLAARFARALALDAAGEGADRLSTSAAAVQSSGRRPA
jgi:GT2 family glycosyltransferase